MNEAVAVMLLNYGHDLATGLLFGAVAAWFLAARTAPPSLGEGEKAAWLLALHRRFRPVVVGALALVILGGFPRAWFYETYEWLPAAGRGQVTALVVKHVILVAVTVLSTGAFFARRPKA